MNTALPLSTESVQRMVAFTLAALVDGTCASEAKERHGPQFSSQRSTGLTAPHLQHLLPTGGDTQ